MFPTSTTVPTTFDAFMAENNLAAADPNLGGWRRIWETDQLVAAHAPTVIPPCPAGCTQPAGHDYPSTDGWADDLTFQRQHVAFAGAVADVSATEHNHYGTVTLDEPEVFLSMRDDAQSVEKVRALAAELLEAAEVLDRIAASA